MSIAVEMAEERRRNPRKRLKQRAVIKTIAGERLEGTVVEISVNGLGVMLPNPLTLGAVCQVVFNIFLNGRNVTVSGAAKVMHCSCSGLDGFRVGMSYAIDNAEVQQVIAEFVG